MKKKALIYFTGFGDSFGGAEYLPLLFAKELQGRYDVTMAVNWMSCDPHKAVEAYDVNLDFRVLRFVALKPKSRICQRFDAVIPVFSVRALQKLARESDLCISCANMVDFGRPAHHFIYLMRLFGDNAFNDFVFHRPPLRGMAALRRKLRTLIAEAILRPLLGVRSARRLLADPRECFYANSEYVARTMHAFYGGFTNHTLYPPTVFEPGDAMTKTIRDPLKVVYIGRLIPQKRVLEALEIVSAARRISGVDLHFSVAGKFTDSAYAERLNAFAARNDWVEFVGEVYLEEKARFLCSGTYAVHTRLDEEFGIAVAEYLKCGVIPVVPNEGGSPEVVAEPQLTYADDETAGRILARLVTDAAFRGEMARRCAARSHVFSRDAYLKRQSDLLERIAGT